MRNGRRGSALVIVLLALGMLLSLGIPFLLASRARHEASLGLFARGQARVAVASAEEFARSWEEQSHPGVDPTPWYDSADEYDPAGAGVLPQALGGDWELSDQDWGLEVENLQARISLASASLTTLQNLLHPCLITEEVDYRATEIPVTSTEGFPDEGRILIGTRWFGYGGRTATAFTEIEPPLEEEVPEDPTNPRFRRGTSVIDPRTFNLVIARLRAGEQAPPEFLGDLLSQDPTGTGTWGLPERRILERFTWYHTGAHGEEGWQPAVWMGRPMNPDFPEILNVTDGSALAKGTVVRLLEESGARMDNLVLSEGGLQLQLALPLSSDFQPYTTRIYPLVREPVDVNAAAPEVLEALLTGLRLRGWPGLPREVDRITLPGGFRRSWMTPRLAREVAREIVRRRPLQGPEDLWERVLVPLQAAGVLNGIQARAIFLNSIDPNSAWLAQSTMPFTYRSGDRYLQRVEAAVRSRLGSTLSRAGALAEHRVAPELPLLRLAESQEDWEVLARYGRGFHGTLSLPWNLGSFGGHHTGVETALALRTGIAIRAGIARPAGPERASEGQVMPEFAREPDLTGPNSRGFTEHFDFEPRPEGWDVREQGPWIRPLAGPDSWGIADVEAFSSHNPVSIQGWFRAQAGFQNAALFDLAGLDAFRGRLSLAFEQGQLVLRLWGNAGDDPADEDGLDQAITLRVDPAEYSFQDRWFHAGALLRAESFGGVQLLVDGVPRGKTDGFTWLTQAVPAWVPGNPDGELRVESTAGFPARGVLLVGEEVMEYSSKTATSFVLERVAGADGYLGGRAAREPNDLEAAALDTEHPSGAGVRLYGYSAPLASDIPPGGGTLSGNLGPWSIAVAVQGPEVIQARALDGQTFEVGDGIPCSYVGPVELAAAVAEDPYYAEAFQDNGGYALLFQPRINWFDTEGCPIGGLEIIRYGRRSGTTLEILERGIDSDNVRNGYPDWNGAPSSFVTEWRPYIVWANGTPLAEDPSMRVFLIPISVGGNGVDDVRYLPALDRSEFVQITTDGDSGLTEWVRYDRILQGHFLRDDGGAIRSLINAMGLVEEQGLDEFLTPPDRGGGPRHSVLRPPAVLPLQEPGGTEITKQFVRTIGQPVEDRNPGLEFIADAFQFRGVMNTFDHAQTAGARFVPVFHTARAFGAFGGYPGRKDRVAVLVPGETGAPAWYTVEWAAVERQDGRLSATHTYVAFQETPGQPFVGNANPDVLQNGNDVRTMVRLVKFPSGERPMGMDRLAMGGDVAGLLPPWPGFVDEFGVHNPGGMGSFSNQTARGRFILDADLSESEQNVFRLNASVLAFDGGHRIFAANAGDFFSLLPRAGLLEIDGERIAYADFDAATGEFTLAPRGRGLLGTEPRGHARGTEVYVQDLRPVTTLTADLAPGEAAIPVESNEGFPAGFGNLLIDEEILHYSHTGNSRQQFLMPRRFRYYDQEARLARNQARGDLDDGILRGRFGTFATDHPAGSLVYCFPARFLDRYVPECDSPAAAWYEISFDEPNAFWRSLWFEAEEPDASHRVRVALRSGLADWEMPVDETPGLWLLEQGHDANGNPVPLGIQDDHLDLRVTFDWEAGAFDPVQFRATGWTTAPRLRRLVLDYLAEGRVERWEALYP